MISKREEEEEEEELGAVCKRREGVYRVQQVGDLSWVSAMEGGGVREVCVLVSKEKGIFSLCVSLPLFS